MKDFDLEMKGLTLDGGDDYDEYEEEIVDRDEEYDDEEYDDEGDDGYDDEEYDDEEYADDDYDDGYDDNYYDERLNKVLDELAELKRSMANPPAVQNNQPTYTQPSIPYVYAGNIPQNQGTANAGNEVVMYNEISRLRDELSKTQSSQNLHVELNRLKDEMERDRKFNESQYQSEIKRLNEKIETLQKNSLGPQSEDSGYLPEHIASEGRAIDSGSFNKLIAINESILQNSKSTDSHVQSELSDIKKRLAALDLDEINRSFSSIKKSVKNGLNPDDIALLSSEVSSLKQALSVGGSVTAVSAPDAKVSAQLEDLKTTALQSVNDDISVLKNLYEINRVVGYADKEEADRKEKLLDAMDEFLALKAMCRDKEVSFYDSFTALNGFYAGLASFSNSDALSLLDACDKLINEMLCTLIDRKTAEDLVRFVDDTALVSLGREKRDCLDKFAVLAQRIVKSDPADIEDILPELLEVKAKLQDAVKQASDVSVSEEIKRSVAEGDADENKIKELCSKIAELRIADVIKFPRVSLQIADENKDKPIVSLMSKIDGILSLLSKGNATFSSISAAPTEINLDEVKSEIVKLCTCKQLDDAVADLKGQYLKIINSLTSFSNGGVISEETVAAVNSETGEPQYSNNELSDQLYNIRDELSKAIHDENILTQDTVELKLTDFTEAQTSAQQQMSEDLEFIKTKLVDAEELINQIADIRSDILSMPSLIDVEPHFTKLYEDLCAQFDKLYEDVSVLVSNTENSIVDRVNESVGTTMENVNAIIDTINTNIDNINALVSGVNTSLDGVNSNFEITNENINNVNNALTDNLLNISTTLDEVRDNVANLVAADVSPILVDSVNELKTSVDDFIIKAAANDEAALNDRLKLLDDISFLRQQVENSQIDETAQEEDALSEQQTIYRELEDTKEKISQDLLLLSDTVNNLNIEDIRENITTIKDTLDIIATDSAVSTVTQDIAELKENHKNLLDTVNNNIAAELDFQTAMQEDLSFIRSKLENDEVSEDETEAQDVITVNDVYNNLLEVSDKLTLIESGSAEDTQTLVEYLEDIKEQLHLKELEPSIEGLTGSEEEKQSLLNEIAEVRERLASVEDLSKEQSDTAMMQLSIITDELNLLKEIIEGKEQQSSEDLTLTLNDLSEKVSEIAENSNNNAVQLSNLSLVMEDIAQIKESLVGENAVAEDGSGYADVLQTVNEMSDRVKDFAERMELISVDIESIPLVLAEINELKEQLDSGSQSENAANDLDALAQKVDEALVKLDTAAADIGSIPLLAMDISEIKEKLGSLSGIESAKASDTVSNSDDIVEQLNILSDKTNEIIERSESVSLSDEAVQSITGEIAEIKERLTSDYEKIQDDISFIRSQIELNVDDSIDVADAEMADEDINAIMDDLTVIKEKLNAADEYDVMAEILSLREDVKASRLVDQSEVSGELESVKSEFNEQNASIIEEIRNLRTDISNLTGTERVEEPTNDEINMVLSEIVSLRDEIQSYKDELNNFIETERQQETETEESAAVDTAYDNITVILDELTSMRSELSGFKEETQEKQSEEIEPLKAELTGLQDGIAELKDMIIRRTTLNSEVAESSDENVVSASGLDVVLNELINLKDDFEAVRAQMSEEINSVKEMVSEEKPVADEGLNEKLAAIEDSVSAIGAQISDLQLGAIANAEDQPQDEKYDRILEAIDAIKQTEIQDAADNGDNFDVLSEMLLLHDEISDIKNSLLNRESVAQDGSVIIDYSAVNEQIQALREQMENLAAPADYSEIAQQIAEIKEELQSEKQVEQDDLKSELAAIKELLMQQKQTASNDSELEMLRNEIIGLRQELAAGDYVSQGVEDVGVTAELMSLKEEILSMKEQLSDSSNAVMQEPDLGVMAEIMSLRDEISAMKEQLQAQPKLSAEPDMTVLTEIMALRDELSELRSNISSPDSDLVETVEQIREDVRVMKDEPDLSALSEVLALRDEFQAMKDEISNKNDKGDAFKSNEEILSEVQSLRDQLFAISMANVNDGSTDKVTYESYNNIILDEITALREELNSYKANDSTQSIIDEISDIKSSLASKTVDEKDLMSQLSKLKTDLESLKNSEAKDATNNAILDELANLKNELTNQREADLTTLNFMSEMAHLIERQNQYINQNANSKITDEIESLKAEIASSLVAPSVETSAIMNEIAKLKEEIALNSEDDIDNQTILDELTKLKDEISQEKPSHQNTIILEEIARIKNEISVLSAKDSNDNKDVSVEEISQSINDLKNELTQIADMVGDESDKPKKTAAKPKTASKKPTAAKKSTKAGTKKAPSDSRVALNSDELISKIEATSIEIPRDGDVADSGEFNPNLDFNYQPQSENSDDMDLASKLAKQVANKLIMEQLVVQLGDGGVPENKVEEIVKDILPQEFSTVQIEEQSDQVRRLANSLVLDKLRSRLTGKKDDKDNG